MVKYLLFDLDGTLCESKKELREDMLQELGRLSKRYGIALVSGAELSRMMIQAPLKYATFMAQNGNESYENDKLLWANTFDNREEVMKHIEKIKINPMTDDMLDDRGCQISFSFIGHHAPLEVKKKFDPDRKVRHRLLEDHPFKGAVIGGTTCIDYIPYTKGENIKRYMDLKDIKPHECLYIGDAFMNHGNDATVLGVIPVHQVNSPLETLNFIKNL
jgi:phosphomannomutase